MERRLLRHEIWLTVQGWPYEVGTYGHIRRKRSKKLINPWWDSDGYGTVLLRSGPRQGEYYLDSLIAATFNGQQVNGQRPLHLNGQPWDNWANNLDWGIGSLPYENMTNLVINWTVWAHGRMLHGPFTNYDAVKVAASRIGDIIIGRNPKREIVAFQIMFSRNQAMSPVNPFDLVRKYEALAKQHPQQFWSHELLEAAQVIAALAADGVNAIHSPHSKPTAAIPTSLQASVKESAPVAPPIARRRVPPPEAPQTRAGIVRRSLAPGA